MKVAVHLYKPTDYLGRLGRLLYWSKYGHTNIQLGPVLWDATLSQQAWCLSERYLSERQPVVTYRLPPDILHVMSAVELVAHAHAQVRKDFGPHRTCVHHTVDVLRAITYGVAVPDMYRIPQLERWLKQYAINEN